MALIYGLLVQLIFDNWKWIEWWLCEKALIEWKWIVFNFLIIWLYIEQDGKGIIGIIKNLAIARHNFDFLLFCSFRIPCAVQLLYGQAYYSFLSHNQLNIQMGYYLLAKWFVQISDKVCPFLCLSICRVFELTTMWHVCQYLSSLIKRLNACIFFVLLRVTSVWGWLIVLTFGTNVKVNKD